MDQILGIPVNPFSQLNRDTLKQGGKLILVFNGCEWNYEVLNPTIDEPTYSGIPLFSLGGFQSGTQYGPLNLQQFGDQLFSGNLGGDNIYNLQSPTTITVGGLPAGTNISGLTVQQIIEMIVAPYLQPTLANFSDGLTTAIVEVGTTRNVGGTITFTRTSTNPSNIQVNSIIIRNVTTNTDILTGLTNDGNETNNVGPILHTSSSPTTLTQSRSIRATSTNNNTIGPVQKNTVTNFIYPIFYGKSSSSPTPSQALINGATKVVANSGGSFSISFGASNEFIWFAIPVASGVKTTRFVDVLNNGNIGGPSDLFGAGSILTINSPTSLRSNVQYRFYVSNFPTSTTGSMTIS